MEQHKAPDLVTTFPDLVVEPDGSSGLSIRAKMGKPYNCAEFTMNRATPVQVFISPWIQFEPVAWNADRQKLAFEIVRRYGGYAAMEKQCEDALRLAEHARSSVDRVIEENGKGWDDHRAWLFKLLGRAGSAAVNVPIREGDKLDILKSLEATIDSLRKAAKA